MFFKIYLLIFFLIWFYFLYSFLLQFFSSSTSTLNSSISTSSLNSLNFNHLRTKNSKFQSLTSSLPTEERIKTNLTFFLLQLNNNFNKYKNQIIEGPEIWKEYFELTKETLIKWDDENKYNLYPIRHDQSIFISIGTYRDPYCPMTLKSIYSQAKNPSKIYISLLQQNCFLTECYTGVLENGLIETMNTDVDCYIEFCNSPEGQASQACINKQIRLFNINESESLGPYLARYLASKFYQGEEYYLQIDSHSEFVKHWDDKLINMLELAPAKKPVISTYPPDSKMNWKDTPGYRICDSEFASEQIEWQIIRLTPSSPHKESKIPVYSPFVAAGFLFSRANILREVPFDPLLPWIFMGEEISMSARLLTSGYDLFSPTTNVLNHYYVRRHYPKYWESVNRYVFFLLDLSPISFLYDFLLTNFDRYFQSPIHNNLVEIVIKRVKYMLNYPELIGHHRHQPPPLFPSENHEVDQDHIDASSARYIDSTVTYR